MAVLLNVITIFDQARMMSSETILRECRRLRLTAGNLTIVKYGENHTMQDWYNLLRDELKYRGLSEYVDINLFHEERKDLELIHMTPHKRMEKKVLGFSNNTILLILECLYNSSLEGNYDVGISMYDWAERICLEVQRRGLTN